MLSFSLLEVVEALDKDRAEVCDGLNSLHLVGLRLGDGHGEELRRLHITCEYSVWPGTNISL